MSQIIRLKSFMAEGYGGKMHPLVKKGVQEGEGEKRKARGEL